MHQTCREPRPVHEYDLFIPLFYNDGRPIEASKFQALQKRLLEQFGGLTFFPQPNQGLWKMGAVVYRDEIVIYRVLAPRPRIPRKFLARLKEDLRKSFRQEEILIVERPGETIGYRKGTVCSELLIHV